MEFSAGNVLLITIGGKFYDQARIERLEETGDGRVLHMVSTVREENKRYKVGEMRDEVWRVFFLDSLQEVRLAHDPRRPILTLEIVR